MSEFLVTGGAGFIGSNIVEELLKHGETVRVIDNFSTGRRGDIEPFIEAQNLLGCRLEVDCRDRVCEITDTPQSAAIRWAVHHDASTGRGNAKQRRLIARVLRSC